MRSKRLSLLMSIVFFLQIGLAQNITVPIRGTFFDGAEDHPSFEINSTHNGWSFIDGDQAPTYGFVGITFPGMGEAMAYIIFSPSETTPPIPPNNELNPHSGNKFFAFLSYDNVQNNDWLISPMLFNPTKFSFWAKNLEQCYCYGEIRIAYSISGKEENDFIFIPQDPYPYIPVYNDWRFYEFDIPQEAKYVAINHIGEELSVMIDDITIEQLLDTCPAITNLFATQQENSVLLEWDAAEGNPIAYKIYIDSLEVAITSTTWYIIENITEGKYILGIEALYEDDCVPIMVNINFIVDDVGIDEVGISDIILIYPNSTTGELYISHISNLISQIEIFDVYGSKLLSFTSHSSPLISINISELQASIYFVRVTTEKGVVTKKILK
jgi:hypothetical protein